MSRSMSIFHVDVEAVNPETARREEGVYGVCADSIQSARAIVAERVRQDGYLEPKTLRAERVAAQGTWEPASTLCYRMHPVDLES